MQSIISKIKYIITEEGIGIFIKRFINYFSFYLKLSLLNQEVIKKDWLGLKNKYKGKRVFLIGNGPSLNKTPLHLLKNEYSICFNRFYLMLERLNWTPTFYSCIDDRVVVNIAGEIRENAPKFEHLFLPNVHPSSGKDIRKHFNKIKNNHWLILNKFGFSNDLPYAGINKTVANVALQVLAFMGFEEIYLIGLDMDYEDHKTVKKVNSRDWTAVKDDDPNHFDPRYFGKGTEYHHPRMDETLLKYKEAKKFYDSMGVKIFNATVGGKLEIFPRVDFRSLFNITSDEELCLFTGNGGTEYKNLYDAYPGYVEITTGEEWRDDYQTVICGCELGCKLISKKIFTHIPKGPIINKIVFIKREVPIN